MWNVEMCTGQQAEVKVVRTLIIYYEKFLITDLVLIHSIMLLFLYVCLIGHELFIFDCNYYLLCNLMFCLNIL